MGWWGHGVMDNDDAADFAIELEEARGEMEPVLQAFAAMLINAGTDALPRAVAAAEAVSRLVSRGEFACAELDTWAALAKARCESTAPVLRCAMSTLDVVLLADLQPDYRVEVQNLRKRLDVLDAL